MLIKTFIAAKFLLRNNVTILYLGQKNSSSCCEHDFPNTKGELEVLITVNLTFSLYVSAQLSYAFRCMKLSMSKYLTRTFTSC